MTSSFSVSPEMKQIEIFFKKNGLTVVVCLLYAAGPFLILLVGSVALSSTSSTKLPGLDE